MALPASISSIRANMPPHQFDEPRYLAVLRTLDRPRRGVFAATCLDYLKPCADAYAGSGTAVDAFLSEYPAIADLLLGGSAEGVDVASLSARAGGLIPDEDDTQPYAAYADDWLAVCAMALGAVADPTGREMLSVARRCYDSADRAAADLLDVAVYNEAELLRHRLVQAELGRQWEALEALGSIDPLPAVCLRLREQARRQGVELRDAIAANE